MKNNILITVIFAAIIVFAIVMIFSLVSMLGSITEASTITGNPAYATGTLTFRNNISVGELVNISVYTFEYTVNGSVSYGHIPVEIPYNSTGKGIAISSLINAMQNNASVSNLVIVLT